MKDMNLPSIRALIGNFLFFIPTFLAFHFSCLAPSRCAGRRLPVAVSKPGEGKKTADTGVSGRMAGKRASTKAGDFCTKTGLILFKLLIVNNLCIAFKRQEKRQKKSRRVSPGFLRSAKVREF